VYSYVPSLELGPVPPPPNPSHKAPLPPEPEGGGGHSPAGEAVGESKFHRLEKKFSTLSTLWSKQTTAFFESTIKQLAKLLNVSLRQNILK
jgi:hypothetical protein